MYTIPMVGEMATSLLRNNKLVVPTHDYEVVDDIKDIIGAENMELLREFVEIAMTVGITKNTKARTKEKALAKDVRRTLKLSKRQP
jgi:hypothetical protein